MLDWQYFRDLDPLPSCPGNIEAGGEWGFFSERNFRRIEPSFDFFTGNINHINSNDKKNHQEEKKTTKRSNDKNNEAR